MPHTTETGRIRTATQDEERLVLAQFLVVPGFGADASELRIPVGEPADLLSGIAAIR